MKSGSLTAGLCAVVLTACTTTTVKEEPPAPVPEFEVQAQVKELWTADVGSLSGKYEAHLAPTLDKGTLYVANVDGDVLALSAESGDVKWKTELDVTVTGATGAGEGLVVIGTRTGEVIALNAETGERRWSSRASSEVDAAPVISKEFVVVQSIDGHLTALSAKDGRLRWTADRSEPALSLRGTSRPLIAGEFVIAGFGSGKVMAFQLKDGKMLWEHEVAQPRGRNDVERLIDVDATPMVWGEAVYAVAYQGKLAAMDALSGRELWSRDASSYVGMELDRNAAYVADADGDVVSYGREAGASLWKQDKLHGRKLGSLTLHGNAVVVGDYEGQLYWLGREDGHFIARYHLDSSPVRASGIVDGDTLYVTSQDGELAALQLVQP